jgi:hypothetical protein
LLTLDADDHPVLDQERATAWSIRLDGSRFTPLLRGFPGNRFVSWQEAAW